MKKILFIILALIIVGFSSYYAFIYYASYSRGDRAGELVKFSKKGIGFKTWEGQISIEATQPLWNFSVQDNNPEVIEKLKKLQGKAVRLTYMERYKTFPWWGETKYFVTEVEQTENVKSKNINTSEENEKMKTLIEENEQLKEKVIELKKTIEDLRTTVDVLKESNSN